MTGPTTPVDAADAALLQAHGWLLTGLCWLSGRSNYFFARCVLWVISLVGAISVVALPVTLLMGETSLLVAYAAICGCIPMFMFRKTMYWITEWEAAERRPSSGAIALHDDTVEVMARVLSMLSALTILPVAVILHDVPYWWCIASVGTIMMGFSSMQYLVLQSNGGGKSVFQRSKDWLAQRLEDMTSTGSQPA